MKRIRCFMVLFTIMLVRTFPQTPGNNGSDTREKKRPLIAGAETLFTNVLFIGVTGLILDYPWAHPTVTTIRENFSHPPLWEDTDGFKVNQIGHPWQGSLYFNSGRVNGFNFYESMVFNALGSVAWETVFESTAPSLNDIITTTFAGAPVGEILHRLYLEADAAGMPLPLSALISPMDGLNRLITGWAPQKAGGNIHELSLSLGAGYAQTDFFEKTNSKNLFSFHGPTGTLGIKTVYGNPFEQRSVIPYEHFELDASFDVDTGNYMDLRIISDGYLFSFSPLHTGNDMLSTGLSLHFDFVSSGKFDLYDSTIDYAGNALCWTVKHQHLFHNGFVLQSKLHGGATFFGVSDYFSPNTADHALKNYGGGTAIRLSLDIEKQKLGRLSLALFNYHLWTYPGTSAVSVGDVFWLFVDVTYSYRISKHLSIGAGGSFVMETGRFAGFPDTQKRSNAVEVFITWNLS
jgi:hypothetical protein